MTVVFVLLTLTLFSGTAIRGETDEDLLEKDDSVLEADESAQHLALQHNWAALFRDKAAQSFADRYSEDAVWLRCTNSIIHGREEVRQGYEDWFKIADRQDNCTHIVTDDLSDDHTVISAACLMYTDSSSGPVEVNRYIDFIQRVEGGFQIIFEINIEDKYEFFYRLRHLFDQSAREVQ